MSDAASLRLSPPNDPRVERSFDARVRSALGSDLHAMSLDTIQVNIGLRCNLACRHCHVESSPARREEMSWETMVLVLDVARRAGATTLDITGGAPEMHPEFRRFVEAATAQGLEVLVRTNLTILVRPGFETMAAFLCEQRVHLVASLPCYLETNVDRQRGRHVYQDSIEAIRRLNAIGYGTRADLRIDLVYNPGRPTLPPRQEALEADYKRELLERFGIRFDRLYTITNMPIGRFRDDLERDGRAETYTELLGVNFNPATLGFLMCRTQLHVAWDGALSDCDFNYALKLPLTTSRRHLRDFEPEEHARRRVRTGPHCFGCTAGAGSSCKGALA